MPPCLWIGLLALLVDASAIGATGSIRTRDGKIVEGEVTLDDNALIVRTADAAQHRIAWPDIDRAILRKPPSPIVVKPPAGATGRTLPEGWKFQDIGDVHSPGSTACDARGLFTIKASGWGAWGPEDSFHFAYAPWEKNVQIIARLVKVDTSKGNVVAGVMLRPSLAPDALMAAACVHPSGEVRLNRRPPGDAPEFRRPEEVTPRKWIRLTRREDVFTAYQSSDGRYWDFVDSKAIPMSDPLLMGLAAWTPNNLALGEAQLDSVTIVPGTPGASWFPDGPPLLEGLVMRDGNVQAGTIHSMNDQAIQFSTETQSTLVPPNQIARMVFNPAPPNLDKLHGKRGVLLTSGDFIEGQVIGVSVRRLPWPRKPALQVGVNSLLFGVKYFETASQTIAAVLDDVTPSNAAFEVHTLDGSVHRTDSVAIKKNGVLVDAVLVNHVMEVIRVKPR